MKELTAPSMRTPIAGWNTHCHRGYHASSKACGPMTHMQMARQHTALTGKNRGKLAHRAVQGCLGAHASEKPCQRRTDEEEVRNKDLGMHSPASERGTACTRHTSNTALLGTQRALSRSSLMPLMAAAPPCPSHATVSSLRMHMDGLQHT